MLHSALLGDAPVSASSSIASDGPKFRLTRPVLSVIVALSLAALVAVLLVVFVFFPRESSSPPLPSPASPWSSSSSSGVAAPPIQPDGWRQTGGDWQHSGVSNGTWPTSAAAVTLLWNLSISSSISCSRGLVGDSRGRLYFTCGPLLEKTYNVYCVDGTQGKLVWKVTFTEPYYSTQGWTPALSEDEKIVFVRSTTLQAFSTANGSLLWAKTFDVTGGSLRGAPVVKGDRLYVNQRGGIAAYDVTSGRLLWQSDTLVSGPVGTVVTPVLTPSGTTALLATQQFFSTDPDHHTELRLHLLGIDAANGKRRWSFNLSLVWPPQPQLAPPYLSYGMAATAPVGGGMRELWYISTFPLGLVVVDALNGTVLTQGQYSNTTVATMASPVLWPIDAPNNPYGQSVVLNVMRNGDCGSYQPKTPCGYQLVANSLLGQPMLPPLPPPAVNGSLQCPDKSSKTGWSLALPVSQPIVTRNGLLLMNLATSNGWPYCFVALDPATGMALDIWANFSAGFSAGASLLHADGKLVMISTDWAALMAISKGGSE
jgi:outer membrane protein assembly factor BamB